MSQLGENTPLFIGYFLLMWIAITTLLAFMAGWFRLMATYPDQNVEPVLRLPRLSGSMGAGVSMRSILTLSVCPPGLRVGIWRLFGPFCRNFLVPWQDITATVKFGLLGRTVVLKFGHPTVGRLRIPAYIALRLARAAGDRWPEMDPIPQESHAQLVRRLLVQWVLMTGAAAAFFIVAAPAGGPPWPVLIVFPAVGFGVATIVQYVKERGS